MKTVILHQFCCGFSVRTGCMIIGIVDLISSVGGLILLGVVLHMDLLPFATEMITIDALPNILTVFGSISLIYGTVKEKPRFMIPCLIVYLFYSALIFITGLASVVHCLSEHMFMDAIEVFFTMLATIAVILYCCINVNTHYRNVVDQVQVTPLPPIFQIV